MPSKSSASASAADPYKKLGAAKLFKIHELMVRARLLEERLIKMSKGGDGFFWIGGPGEEAFNVSLGLQVKKGSGVNALLQASEYARRDLKDFSRQIEILRRVSDDYFDAREAPQALYDAAEAYEDSVKDNAKAIETYREIATKFPSHKLARRAESRAAKLEAK